MKTKVNITEANQLQELLNESNDYFKVVDSQSGKNINYALLKDHPAIKKLIEKSINDLDRRSIFEKAIDWVSYKLFGNNSCMPNELKSFR